MSQALSPQGAPRNARSCVVCRGLPGSRQDSAGPCVSGSRSQCLRGKSEFREWRAHQFAHGGTKADLQQPSLHVEERKQINKNPSVEVRATTAFSVVTCHWITLC